MPEALQYTKQLEIACKGKEIVLFVVPSAFIRKTAAAAAPYLDDGAILVCASKGFESGSLKTMTEVIEEEVFRQTEKSHSLVALSGPTHAEEVALGLPASIVAAGKSEETSLKIAQVFCNSALRV